MTAALLTAPAAAQAVQPVFSLGPSGPAQSPPGTGIPLAVREPCPADLNGDGNADVVLPVTANTGTRGGFWVWWGDGSGALADPTQILPMAGSQVGHCSVGDFDGDGQPDLVLANETSGAVTVELTKGDGTFTAVPLTPPGTSLGDVKAADLNHDGFDDFVVATNAPADQLIGYISDGHGGFTAGTPVALPAATKELAVGDLNGDGRDDLAVAVNGSPIRSEIPNPDGSLTPVVSGAGNAFQLALGDLNGDGLADVVSDASVQIAVALGTGTGVFTTDTAYPSTNLDPPRSIELADLNGDGRLDVISAGEADPSHPIEFQTITGKSNTAGSIFNSTFDGPFVANSATNGDAFVAAADMNNDGREDVVVGASRSSVVGGPAVLLNTTPIPGATTGAATPQDVVASVAGTIQPSGQSTNYGVDLLSESGAVDHHGAAGTVSGTGTTNVSIPLAGLTPATTYRYRVYAQNPSGLTVGGVKTFTTTVARPANTAPPGLSGTATPGQTLSCTDGSWTGSPALSVQWLRGGLPIAGQTQHTYTLLPNDLGSTIACRVAATNAGGTVIADSAGFVVGAGAPSNVTLPALGGTVGVGQTLACNPGNWSAGGTFTYAWLRDGDPIARANGITYTLVTADSGHRIGCRVTLTNSSGAASADSATKSVPKPPCIVPQLKGVTLASAKKKLAAANCKLGKVTRRKGTGVKVGRVLKSSPKAGTRKSNGAKVKLILRKA